MDLNYTVSGVATCQGVITVVTTVGILLSSFSCSTPLVPLVNFYIDVWVQNIHAGIQMKKFYCPYIQRTQKIDGFYHCVENLHWFSCL